MMNTKHLLLLTAMALVSFTLFSASCKKGEEPKDKELPEAHELPAHIKVRMVKDLYFPETKLLEKKKDDIFLAMEVLGWENKSLPAFRDPSQAMTWSFALVKGKKRKERPFEYAIYLRVPFGDIMPKGVAFAKAYKPKEYSDALLAKKGGLLERYGFTDNYFKWTEEKDASKWGAMAKNSKLNLGAIILVKSGVSYVVDGVDVEEPGILLTMFVADWEDLKDIFDKFKAPKFPPHMQAHVVKDLSLPFTPRL